MRMTVGAMREALAKRESEIGHSLDDTAMTVDVVGDPLVMERDPSGNLYATNVSFGPGHDAVGIITFASRMKPEAK